jgi:hypothetical protein
VLFSYERLYGAVGRESRITVGTGPINLGDLWWESAPP